MWQSNSLKREDVAGEEVDQGGEQEAREEGKAMFHREGATVEGATVEGVAVEGATVEEEVVGEAGAT